MPWGALVCHKLSTLDTIWSRIFVSGRRLCVSMDLECPIYLFIYFIFVTVTVLLGCIFVDFRPPPWYFVNVQGHRGLPQACQTL